MKTRTRLTLYLTAVVLLTNAASAGLVYWLALITVTREFRAKLLSIAASTARTVDVETVTSIQSRADENSDLYRRFLYQLNAVLGAGRHGDPGVLDVFSVTASRAKSGRAVIGADPNGREGRIGHAGELYEYAPVQRMLGGTASEDLIIEDHGVLLAHAPVRELGGKIVAVIVAEGAAGRPAQVLRRAAWTAAIAPVIATLLAVPVIIRLRRQAWRAGRRSAAKAA